MIVSTATAVLPVWRSPMISSRWPRPIGTIASIALRPVCIGSLTGLRSTTPGASRSISLNCFDAIGPLPSIGWPSALTTRPISASPTGTEMMRLVRLTVSPSRIAGVVAEEHRADAFFFEVQRDAEHAVRELEHLAGHRLLDAVHARDAVADRDDGADFGDVDVDGIAADLVADDSGDLFGFDVHSFVLGARGRPACSAPLAAAQQHFLACRSSCRADAAVVHRAADAGDGAADDRRIDPRVELHVAAGGRLRAAS